MKELKFRVWDENLEKIFEVFLIDFKGILSPLKKPQIVIKYDNQLGYIEYDEKLLMQYTGLKDKNGKEVYEGDIISFGRSNLNEEILAKVYYSEEEACFKLKYNQLIFMSGDEEYEVIGNIYENPELLERIENGR